jgi:hypothetical protein
MEDGVGYGTDTIKYHWLMTIIVPRKRTKCPVEGSQSVLQD